MAKKVFIEVGHGGCVTARDNVGDTAERIGGNQSE